MLGKLSEVLVLITIVLPKISQELHLEIWSPGSQLNDALLYAGGHISLDFTSYLQ